MSARAASLTTHTFPHSKFTDPKSQLEKLQCHVCYEIPKQANTFKCCLTKLVCGGCIESTFRINERCPFCRRPQQEVSPNEFVQNLINELEAKCSHDGCEHTALLENMIYHEKNLCEFRIVHCDFCNNPFVFNNLAEHKKICELRPMPCEHCKLNFKPGMMVHHLETSCEGINRPCPDGCGEMITFPMFATHAALCLEHKVPCSWADHGCTDLVPRKDLAAHNANLQDHITRAITHATSAHATSAAIPSHISLRQIAWPPSYDMLMSLTGEYFVPQHNHALKVSSGLYGRNLQGQIKLNTCNVKTIGCTGHIQGIPGIPVQDRFGEYQLFGARCESCDFDACINCLIVMQCLPTRNQLIAMEQKYKGVPHQMAQDLAQAHTKIGRLIDQVDRQASQITQLLARYDVMHTRLEVALAQLAP